MQEITIYHSPDADDAFMFYGLVHGGVTVPGFNFKHDLCDIESLNHRTLRGELDVTAVSVHALSHIAGDYAVLRCGASMGGPDYGPRLVARGAVDLRKPGLRIAIPGELTSAALSLKLYLQEEGLMPTLVNIHFQEIEDAISRGEIDCGVIIHEGQITHTRDGFTTLLDLGEWWWKKTGLPLPLGVNVVRKSLGIEAMNGVYTALKNSIECALNNRDAALKYALEYGRGLSYEDADTFVGMYVNERTRDLGADGIRSIELFLKQGHQAGLIPHTDLEFIGG